MPSASRMWSGFTCAPASTKSSPYRVMRSIRTIRPLCGSREAVSVIGHYNDKCKFRLIRAVCRGAALSEKMAWMRLNFGIVRGMGFG